MKLVILQMDAAVPDNASWACFKLPADGMEAGFLIQGHKVVEVEDARGEELLEEMGKSIGLQLQLRDLYYPPVKVETP